MKYIDMPLAMWLIFAKSFRNNLTTVLGIEPAKAKEITKKAKRKYKEIIARIPEFEKKDRFKMNLINCAMFSAFLLTMPTLPDVDAATEYYKKSMMTGLMEWFCRQSGKSQYSPSDIRGCRKWQHSEPVTETLIPGTWISGNMKMEAATKRNSIPVESAHL